MKKTIYITLFIANSFLMLFSLLYLFNGSLEVMTTFEQQEKIRIVTGGLFALSVVIDVILVFAVIKKQR